MSKDINSQRRPFWTRREIIGGGAAALGAGLAGCIGGDDDSDGGEGREEEFVYAFGGPPSEVQFNVFDRATWGGSLAAQLQHYIAKGDSEGNVWPDFLEGMSTEENVLTLEFPEGYTWWGGETVTAEDYWTNLEIRRLQDPEGSNIEENVLVDDYTIERRFKGDVDPSLMRASIVPPDVEKVCTPRWIYGEYLERLQEATTQEERDEVSADLQDLRIPMEQFVEEGLGNGPYEVVDWSDSETILERYDDHPLADQTNIERVRIVTDQVENYRGRVVNDEMDMEPQGLIGEPDRGDFPDNLENWYELDWFRMQKITFNWKNEHLAKRPVRRAIAHALDLNPMVQAAEQAGLTGDPPEYQTGIRSSIHETYLGEGWVDQLIEYPVEADEEGAAELLEQAGYAQSDGVWEDEDGEPVEFSFLTSDGQHQNSLGVIVSDQLESFGFQMDVTTVGENDFYQRLEQYDQDMWWVWHVAGALWHPTSYFSNDFVGVEVGDPRSDSDTGVTGIPFELEIPDEVGAEQIDGDGRTIQPAQLMNDLEVASSEEEVEELTRTLVQWFNFDLPNLVWIEELNGSWGDVQAYDFPEHDEDSTKLNMDRPGETALTHCWIDHAE